jgi:hypothetical protein
VTDAELVALLLAEARAKRARFTADPGLGLDPRTYEAHHAAKQALDAAVLGRLDAEAEL